MATSKGNWIVEIRDNDDNVLSSWNLNDNLPLPQIGYTIWLDGRAYSVKEVHIGYDDRTIVIFAGKILAI